MADAPDTAKTDYRSTVFLPRTDFPMKAGLPQKEPAILARWEAEAARSQRKLGQAISDDGQGCRGDDRLRAVQIRRERPAVPRRQAGDVVAGREDRAGRSRDRI